MIPITAINDEKVITDLLKDGSNRGIATDTNWLNFIIANSSGRFKYTKLEEKVMSDHWGFVFDYNHSLYKAFNSKIVQLVEAGLAGYIVSQDTARSVVEEKSNVVLTMEHLGIWFIIALCFIGCAVVVFLMEIVVSLRRGERNLTAKKIRKSTGKLWENAKEKKATKVLQDE
jgi:hypothetical protein